MGYNGSNMQVDFKNLWLAGKQDLPRMAYGYTTANNTVHQTHLAKETKATQFFPKWEQLRDELQWMLKHSADNLVATGEALCTVAKNYEKTDTEAAAGIKSAEGELSTEQPAPHNPTRAPTEPAHSPKPNI